MATGWLRQEFTEEDMHVLYVQSGSKFLMFRANSVDEEGNEQIKIGLSDGSKITITHVTAGLRFKDYRYEVKAKELSFIYASYTMIFENFQRVLAVLQNRGVKLNSEEVVEIPEIPAKQVEGQLRMPI